VTYARLSGTRISGENIRTGEVYLGKRIDRFDDQTTDTNNRLLLGGYVVDGQSNPTFKAIGQAGGGAASGDYMFMSPNDNTMFEIRSGGDLRFRVQGSGADTPEVFIDNLNLKDLSIEGTLTMGSNGKIVNSSNPSDYRLDSDGFTMRAGTGLLARRISWEENGNEIARIASDNGTMETIVNGDEASGYSGLSWYAKEASSSSGDTDRIKMGIDYRPDGEDAIEMLLTDTDGIFTTGYPEFRIGQIGTDDRGFSFYPNEGLLHFENPRTSDPSDSTVQDICSDGEFVLYAYEEGNGDVRLKYAERKPDGSVATKTIKD
jgi:hypothetical protein